MRLTKSSGFSNTSLFGDVTYRHVGTYGVVIIVGVLLFRTPLFRWNIPAIVAYIMFSGILIGQTPTNRTILRNLYGLLFRRPIRQMVTEDSSTNTFGHGIRDVYYEDDIDAPIFRRYDKMVMVAYRVTSGINHWSTREDYERQAQGIKVLFNVFEGDEGLHVITKIDADMGMLQLEEELLKQENYEGDDLEALASNRRELLHRVATREAGRSVQQYVVLKVKSKNLHRCINALRESTRVMSPAPYPGDVILAAMGMEGSTDMTFDSKDTNLGGDANGSVEKRQTRRTRRTRRN